MHVGSAYAVCSPNPTVKDTGMELKPNPLQKKLYDIWCWVRDSVSKDPHVLCLNGEPLDGPNSKQLGQQSWTTNVTDQLDDAERLLKMYKPKHFLMTRGSGYHVQKDATNHEEILANRLGCIPYSGYFGKSADTIMGYHDGKHLTARTDYYLNFSVNGKVFSVTHHIGFNRWFAYRTTALAREMADMEFLRDKYWKAEDMPSVIVRSHVHYFVYVRIGTGKTHGITTPCWKFPDSHLFKGGLGGTAPSIGGVEVIVESNGKIIVEPYIVSHDDYPRMQILRL